jgi:dimeric dUTPase (all-alpha-NTP-PPase superfamily)
LLTFEEYLKLSSLQSELDNFILERSLIDKKESLIESKILALLTEVMEIVNEHQGFKY